MDRQAIGRKSKRKGKTGELEFCRLCNEHGWDAKRTAQVKGKTGEAGDVEGLPGIHVEVKRTEAFHLYDALDQSRRDAIANGNGDLPIVAYRKNDCRWVVVMDAHDWFTMYNASIVTAVKHSQINSAEEDGKVVGEEQE